MPSIITISSRGINTVSTNLYNQFIKFLIPPLLHVEVPLLTGRGLWCVPVGLGYTSWGCVQVGLGYPSWGCVPVGTHLWYAPLVRSFGTLFHLHISSSPNAISSVKMRQTFINTKFFIDRAKVSFFDCFDKNARTLFLSGIKVNKNKRDT